MNISKLNNITPFTVNNSLISDTNEISVNIISNANTSTDGYFGLGLMIILFLVLLIILSTEQDVFRFGFVTSLLVSSGISLLMGIVLLMSNMISSYQHVMWFAIIFMVSVISKYYEGKQ